MTTEELEKRFAVIAEITDRVALINSPYESDYNGALEEMRRFTGEIMEWDISDFDEASRLSYLSHLSFHREIVADIITEARRLLIDERRLQLKTLVNYHKTLSKWLQRAERTFRASPSAQD